MGRGVGECLSQRRQRAHGLCAFLSFDGADLGPPRSQVADNVAEELAGRHHFQVGDWLQESMGRLADPSLIAIIPALRKAISDESTVW